MYTVSVKALSWYYTESNKLLLPSKVRQLEAIIVMGMLVSCTSVTKALLGNFETQASFTIYKSGGGGT